MAVAKNEFLWREWVLGEARYKGKGPRSQPRPDVGYGGPGQRPVPSGWWQRLEAFLAERREDKEPAPPEPLPKPGQLSAHFNVREFDCHDGRKVPNPAVPALTRLCVVFLEVLRAKFGPALVMSGYRHSAYNAKIGGAKASQHIYDLTPGSVAADMIFQRGTPQQWAAEARRISNAVGYGGVGEYPPIAGGRSGFVHVDNRPVIARWSG